MGIENALYCGGRGGEDADHDVLDGKVLVAQALCRFLGSVHDALGLAGKIDVIVAGDLGHGVYGRVELGEHRVAVNAHLAKQRRDKTAVLIYERIEHMLRGYILIIVLHRHGFCGLEHFESFLSEVLCIHKNTFF